MSSSYVTIGGKEIYTTSGSAARGHATAAPKPALYRVPAARQPSACDRKQKGRARRILGLVVALGLLVFLVTWLSQRHHQR